MCARTQPGPYVAWLLTSPGKSYLTARGFPATQRHTVMSGNSLPGFAVAIGVGLAVVLGLLRIHHNLRLAPLIYIDRVAAQSPARVPSQASPMPRRPQVGVVEFWICQQFSDLSLVSIYLCTTPF